MSHSIGTRLFLLVLAATLAVPAFAGAERAGMGIPIRIGGTLSLSGKYEEMGRMQEKGYRLWEDEINRTGGLLGRPVKLLVIDDESSATKAVAAYSDLLARKAVDLLFTPFSSELTLAVADLFEKYRYPVLAAGAASEKIWETPRRYIFGLYSTADRYFIGFLELCAIQQRKTVAITGFPDPFSLYAAQGAKKWAEKFGLKVVHYNILAAGEEKQCAAEAARIASVMPDAVVVTGFLKESTRLRVALDKAGRKSIAFAGSVGPAMPEFQKVLGPLAEGVFGASQWEPDERISYPGSRAFLQLFRKTYGHDPSYHAANAYAALKLLGDAVEKVGSIDREKIRQAIVSGEHKTIVGPFKLRDDGTQIGHKSIIIQWQGGKKEIVWPETMRTAPPVFVN
jgi:branched-chain amino acid transport system substrate-binding protein